ncbi:MAG TPA: hypothetical protein PK691_01945, partial [Thermomicrobiales bacterium]|nr:hypothetical protein [Thermomicrobiales bacterium]
MHKEAIGAIGAKLRGSRTDASRPGAWERARGATRFSARFDAIGNFPGYQTWAALIVGAKTELTSQFLLVDEFAPHGLALPLDLIVDYSVDREESSFGDVIVRFRTGADLALFRLRASRSRLHLPTRTNPTHLATALADVGLRATDFAQTMSGILRVAWETAHTFDSDEAVWAGEVTAPLRPGMECAPASAWVTKNNLLWGSKRDSGLNRIPTGAITNIVRHSLADGRTTPIAYVHTNLIHGLDLALPFIFNQVSGAQARIERDAFVALFHPDLVRDSAPEPMQAWSSFVDSEATEETTDSPLTTDDADLPRALLLSDEQIAGM